MIDETTTNDARSGELPDRDGQPWLTATLIAASLGIFLALQQAAGGPTHENLATFGVRDARELRGGAWEGLFAPVVVHYQLLHLAFNAYWLWYLGSACERAIGTWRFALLVLGAAFASTTAEFALSDSTGVGASGVLYGIFGFVWIARPRYERFRLAAHDRVVRLLLIWLFACIPLKYLGLLPVANGAHFGGFLFGAAAAACFVRRVRVPLTAAACVVLLSAPAVSLVWAPWSVLWLSDEAVEAFLDGDYQRALELYDAVIERRPDHPWAYGNRAQVHDILGDDAAARADREQAERLGP